MPSAVSPDLPDGTIVIEADGTPPYNVYVKDAEGGWPGHEWVQTGVEGWVPEPKGAVRAHSSVTTPEGRYGLLVIG